MYFLNLVYFTCNSTDIYFVWYTNAKVVKICFCKCKNFINFAKKNLMRTYQIEVRNENAFKILKDLENVNLIKFKEREFPKNEQKISEQFYGCFADEPIEDINKFLKNIRNEWERDIY